MVADRSRTPTVTPIEHRPNPPGIQPQRRVEHYKGLKRFFETDSLAGVQVGQAKRLRALLAAHDTAISVRDMDVPGLRPHRLKHKGEEQCSVRVSGNWRLTFEFRDGQAHVVEDEDYH